MKDARVVAVVVCVAFFGRPVNVNASPEVTQQAKKFVEAHEARFRTLEVEGNLAWWDANTSGKDADYERKEKIQNKIDEALANPKAFEEVKALREKAKDIDDANIRRCIELLYLSYLEKQLDTALLKKI